MNFLKSKDAYYINMQTQYMTSDEMSDKIGQLTEEIRKLGAENNELRKIIEEYNIQKLSDLPGPLLPQK